MLLAAALLIPTAASPEDTFTTRWQQSRAKEPDGAELVISAPKTWFFLGETIPLQLMFASTQPKSFLVETQQQDRGGRVNGADRFIVDPASFAEDPLRGLPGEDGGMGGLSGGPLTLSEKPVSFERVLNEWVRFRKPGTYRVYVLSHRVKRAGEGARGTPIELASNILTIDVRPAPALWVKDQIAAATSILDAPDAIGDDAAKDRVRAGRILRFLDTPEAAAELAKHLGAGQDVDSYALHMGVLGSPYRSQLLPLLEQRLVAPDQPVWGRYLDTLANLAELVESGGPTRRTDLREKKRNEYVSRLIASLASKQPQARAISMNALLESASGAGSKPPWLAGIVTSLIADYRNLPVMTQRDLLEYRWSTIGSPAMIPVLRDLYANPPAERIDPPIENIALRRLYELAPDEGRQILLAEIRHPTKNLRWPTLAMLPDRTLPELNDRLAERAEAHDLDERLILRYATGDIVERVKRAYLQRNADLDRQKLPHCMSPLVFYFLQYDPAFGERELRNNLSAAGGWPACYDIGFQVIELGRYAMSPALERLAIEYLASPAAVAIKRGAAEVLGKYGSAAAKEPLWKTMEYFRSWWKGREEQLSTDSPGRENMQLERALRIALAQADAWALTETDLNRLLGLCSSEWCRQEVTEWLRSAKTPL
jgi:hypothetical protein